MLDLNCSPIAVAQLSIRTTILDSWNSQRGEQNSNLFLCAYQKKVAAVYERLMLKIFDRPPLPAAVGLHDSCAGLRSPMLPHITYIAQPFACLP